MEREAGGRFRMGNTCTPVADACLCMVKPMQYCKVNNNNKRKKKKKRERERESSTSWYWTEKHGVFQYIGSQRVGNERLN